MIFFLQKLLLCLIFLSVAGFSQTYTTNFDSTQNPISEGGVWLNGKTVGLDWYDIATSSGIAHGTNTVATYSDPTAILKGTWSADQTAQATVYSVNPTNSVYQEVELRLRSTMTAHSSRGYEVFFRCLKTAEAYTQIVKWNGALADFTYIASNTGAQYGVANGDVVKATIVGNVITAYINGVLKAQATDNTYSTGNPGIGFNYGCNGTYNDFGFTSYTVTAGGTGNDANLLPASPRRFSLSQNSPNPFHSETALWYELPWQGYVTLKVYDMLGREVATLVNEQKNAGSYTVRFDGLKVTSGICTARLTAGKFVQTRRMLLLK